MRKIPAVAIALTVTLVAGVALRVYGLGKQSVWLDEAYSVMMSGNVKALWQEQVKDSSPPVYYSMLHYWIQWFGKGEFSIRLPSAIFGILLIPLIFFAAAVIFDKRTGVFAALLAAVSPFHIYYSQEARMYSLLPLVSLGAYLFLYRAITEKKKSFWTAYTFAAVLCLYTHNYGFLLIAAAACFYIFLVRDKRGTLPQFLASLAVIMVAGLPRALVLFRQAGMDMNPWIQTSALRDMASSFLHFSLLPCRMASGYPETLLMVSLPVFALVFLFAVVNPPKQVQFLLWYLFIPLALAAVISFRLPIYVAGRYDIAVFPAFCLLMGYGLARVKGAFLRAFLLLLILASTAFSLYRYYFTYVKSNDREISRYVQERVSRGDVIVAAELSLLPFQYYWSREFTPRSFRFPEGPSAYLVRKAFEGDRQFLDSEAEKVTSEVYPLISGGNKLWVIYQPIADGLILRLRKDLKESSVIEFAPGNNLNQAQAVYCFGK